MSLIVMFSNLFYLIKHSDSISNCRNPFSIRIKTFASLFINLWAGDVRSILFTFLFTETMYMDVVFLFLSKAKRQHFFFSILIKLYKAKRAPSHYSYRQITTTLMKGNSLSLIRCISFQKQLIILEDVMLNKQCLYEYYMCAS